MSLLVENRTLDQHTLDVMAETQATSGFLTGDD